jgi:hypothetical protein
MDLATAILTIAGLVLFETITSIDNAIINAEVPIRTLLHRFICSATISAFSDKALFFS